MRKIINAEGQEFVPVSTDDLVLDAVPTVNSFNSVTSDAVARAIAGASGEVPQVTEGDNGKILTAIYDAGGPAVEWGEPAPEYTAGHGIAIDGNKVISAVGGAGITVTSSSTQTIELEMPCYSTQWVPGLAVGNGLTMLTSDLLGEVANGIDVTTDVALSADVTQSSGGTSGVVAYAAIFKINADHSTSKANRLVLDEITVFDWNTGDTFLGIDSGAVITYNSAHVNTTYSTITLADVEAAPTNYALSVFIYNPNGMGTFQYDTMSVETTAGSSDPTMLVTSSYGKSVPGGAITVTNPVPVPQPSDNGKVLGVRNTSGALGWVDQPADELPSISGNAGKVLTVNSGATGVEWASAGGGSGGVVMIDYTETDKNLFNAAVAGITNGQPVFVTRSPDQNVTFPAIPLVQKITMVDGNVTYTELCFTCTCVQNANNSSIAAKVQGFALLKTSTYNPETGATSNRYDRTSISRTLQFSA